MALDPQARLVLDAIAKQNRPELSTLSPDIAREDSLRRARSLPPGPEAVVSEESIPGPSQPMPVRVYRPPGSEGRVLPALVYFHGGGFVVGSLDQSDADCRRLATAVPCAVASVDYPLAPEHRFPEVPDACLAATRWVYDHAAELALDPR